jgi:hypothetical protein
MRPLAFTIALTSGAVGLILVASQPPVRSKLVSRTEAHERPIVRSLSGNRTSPIAANPMPASAHVEEARFTAAQLYEEFVQEAHLTAEQVGSLLSSDQYIVLDALIGDQLEIVLTQRALKRALTKDSVFREILSDEAVRLLTK